jgi:hypothetical protein
MTKKYEYCWLIIRENRMAHFVRRRFNRIYEPDISTEYPLVYKRINTIYSWVQSSMRLRPFSFAWINAISASAMASSTGRRGCISASPKEAVT